MPARLTLVSEPTPLKGDAYYDVTTESLRLAKLAQKLDRMQVYADTGVRIDDEGHFILPREDASIGVHLQNVMSAAIYGPRGEHR